MKLLGEILHNCCHNSSNLLDLDLGIKLSFGSGVYEKQTAENINILLTKINDQTKDGEQHLVLTDELTADKDGDNFTECLDGVDKPIALMAVNPAAFEMSKEIAVQPPEGENVTNAQMKTKHRNAFPIGNLLVHYNHHIHTGTGNYKCITSEDDVKLDASKMAQGLIPIWIKGQTISDLGILQYILDKLLKDEPSVTLLYPPEKQLTPEIEDFCEKQNWKTNSYYNMTGSEDECIISVVENKFATLETFSRAKKKLVIITKKVICL